MDFMMMSGQNDMTLLKGSNNWVKLKICMRPFMNLKYATVRHRSYYKSIHEIAIYPNKKNGGIPDLS